MENRIIPVRGFSWFGKNIGIKDETLDFGGILSDVPCQAAAVFTKNSMPGAPVIVGKDHIKDGLLQAVIVNSKNANVATGSPGIEDAKRICALAANACKIEPEMVLPSSTGVIGQRLPMDKIAEGCRNIAKNFGKTTAHIGNFTQSIMTTDRWPKFIAAKAGQSRILGVAKGAGMIEPDMATMLCYFVTDAEIKSPRLKSILSGVADLSFNRISVDTDTSTSDTAAILANGLAGAVDPEKFEMVLSEMAVYLAREIVRDGEGTTKLIELLVSGASTFEQALLTAKTVINSPLVKTAIHGADPNWGRFVMAIGKVRDYSTPIEDLKIFFGQGENRLKIDAETLGQGRVPLSEIADMLKENEIFIEIVVGDGDSSARVWGCDLTESYIKLNSEYTT